MEGSTGTPERAPMEGSTGTPEKAPTRVARVKRGKSPGKKDDDPKISLLESLEECEVGLHILPKVIKDMDAKDGQ